MSGKSRARRSTWRALVRAAAILLAGLAATTPAEAQAPRRKPPARRPPKKPAKTPEALGKPSAESAAEPGAASAAERRGDVSVSVIEVAGGLAYLKPGRSSGVHRGSRVVVRGRAYGVLEATATYCTVAIEREPLREGDTGTATPSAEGEAKPRKLPPPRPASMYAEAWPDPAPPADRQTPAPVPLGAPERDRRFDLYFATVGGALVPLDGRGQAIGRVEVQARVHAEPLRSAPLAFDADVALQRWFAGDLSERAGGASRPLVRVRELGVSYGSARSFMGSLGRMRYAASTLGPLDGLRVQAPLGSSATVSAFGGFQQNPLNNAPSTAAQRFGVEARYFAPNASLRPEAALVLHGSTFDGRLDERRVSAVVGLFPGAARVGGHVEVSGFDRDNPWGASPVELTAAGVDASVRFGPVQVGARLDHRQQERSRWLASFLPLAWFCTPVAPAPGSPPGPETCASNGSFTRDLAAADASLLLDSAVVTVGGTAARDLSSSQGIEQLGGFAHGRVMRLFRVGRVDASGSTSSGTYLDMHTWSAGPGASLFHDALDVGVYYRQAFLRYRILSDTLTQNAVGAVLTLLPRSDVAFAVQGEGSDGTDHSVLYLFGSLAYRPTL